MRFSLKTFFLFAITLVALAVFSGNILLGRIARSDQFRRFAEQKIGEYLKAKVNIGEIRPYRFNQIALEKIIIEPPAVKSGSQLIRLERLIFRYDLRHLFSRRLDIPAGVVLKNPSILIEQDQLPYFYFAGGTSTQAGISLPVMDFQGGEIRYLLPGTGKEVLLTQVEGKISPGMNHEIQVDVRARASGVLEGKARIYGVILPETKSHDLWLQLKAMNVSKDIPLPLKEVDGKLHWVGQDLFFDGLQATLHGWRTELSGSFVQQGGFPEITWRMRIGKGKQAFRLDFVLNLAKQSLRGLFQPAMEHAFQFAGQVRQSGKRFFIDSLRVDDAWEGQGALDFASGNYHLSLDNGLQRFAVHSNLQGLDFAVDFNFDHWKVFDLDVITRGKMYLHSLTTRWHDRNFIFKGSVETDYFILGQQPFEDLAGVFEVSPYGVTGIRVSWGQKFLMTGQVRFAAKKPVGKFLLRVSDFDLGRVQEFASKPLPKELGGFLSGKIEIQGELDRMETVGAFNIRDGRWGRLYYDYGIIQFRGVPPYLPLQDSKIWKGRTTFFLKGALDLRLDNVFSSVKIETPDHLVIWKGIEAVLHETDRSAEMSPTAFGRRGEFPVLEAEAKTIPAAGASPDGQDEEQTVSLGPKWKF